MMDSTGQSKIICPGFVGLVQFLEPSVVIIWLVRRTVIFEGICVLLQIVQDLCCCVFSPDIRKLAGLVVKEYSSIIDAYCVRRDLDVRILVIFNLQLAHLNTSQVGNLLVG